MRRLVLALLVLLAVVAPAHAQGPAPFRDPHHTLVLCESGDPYAALGEEIAATEGLELFDNWADALAAQPWTILWVVAPETLTEQRFAEAGMLLREHGPVSLGLISGSTIDHARALWQREPSAEGAMVSLVPREGVLERHASAVVSSEPISPESVLAALQEARIVSYQGHGTRSSWHVMDGEGDWRLTAANLPEMNAPVVVAGACQTFKVWSEGSIAIAFADQGAAAYMGYLHSPQGYAFGEPKGFAEARTWGAFPLGMLVAVQNRGLRQGHLAWPYLFVLGDPRISLAEGPPYAIASDDVQDNTRVLTLHGLPEGPVPVLVAGGAEYAYAVAQGVGRAYHGDPLYDADMQMIDVGPHKYILVDSSGGELNLVLRKRVPAWVRVFEPLGDALDHMTLIHHTQGSLAPNVVLMVGVWLAVLWRVLRRKAHLTDSMLPAAVAGVALTAARAAYAVLRAPYLTLLYEGYLRTMDPTWDVSWLFLLSSLAMIIGAAWLLLNARRWWGKVLAALLVVAPTSLMAPFWLALSAALNLLAWMEYGAPLYGCAMGAMGLIACAVEGALVAVALVVAGRR